VRGHHYGWPNITGALETKKSGWALVHKTPLNSQQRTLEGNLLEFGTGVEVERAVRDAVQNGGRDHFILAACDVVAWTISHRLPYNIARLIDAGVRYGACIGAGEHGLRMFNT
jgi:hypothetical protein